MTKRAGYQRKRRTRQHVIASQSANYVERFVIDEGHTTERVENDYGYDLVITTYDAAGYIEEGQIYVQLKASAALRRTADAATFTVRMGIEDYNLWRYEPMPVFLIIYDAGRRRAYWLYFQRYFEQDASREPKRNAQSLMLRIPARNRMNRRAVAHMRQCKNRVLKQLDGVIHHA